MRGSRLQAPGFRRNRSFLMTAAMLFACAVALSATTVIPMSVEQLTRAADNVVEARAVRSHSAWNEQHTLIYTYTTYQVTRRLKGAAAQTITVKQLGGSAGGYTQHVAGIHYAQAGEDALLFLRPSVAGDGTLVVVGLIQGNFRVFRVSDGTSMVSNGVAGAEQFERGSGKIGEFSGAAMSLAEAEARVGRVPR